MTTNAEISPYLTNHSLQATTVTVLSSQNFETRNIKAITGHRSDTSIESYCKRPTLNQFKDLATALTHFVSGDENQPPVNASPAAVPSRPEHELIPALPASQQSQQMYLVAKMRIIWLQMELTLEQFFPRARLKTVPFRLILM